MTNEQRYEAIELIAEAYKQQVHDFQIQTLNQRFGADNVREAIELVGPVAAENFLATRGHCPEA